MRNSTEYGGWYKAQEPVKLQMNGRLRFTAETARRDTHGTSQRVTPKAKAMVNDSSFSSCAKGTCQWSRPATPRQVRSILPVIDQPNVLSTIGSSLWAQFQGKADPKKPCQFPLAGNYLTSSPASHFRVSQSHVDQATPHVRGRYCKECTYASSFYEATSRQSRTDGFADLKLALTDCQP